MLNRPISASWKAPLWGVFPFILWGAVLIAFEIPHEWSMPAWIQDSLAGLLLALLLVPPIGLGVGWIRGFPRWSYPYLTMAVVFSLYMTEVATPGLELFGRSMFGRELWGWRAWIPALLAAAVAFLVSRSLRPLLKLFANVRNDLTLLTYAMFGLTPLLVFVFFDEIDRLYSLVFMVIFTVVTVVTALFYLRSEPMWKRTLALVLGAAATVGILVIGPNAYWQSHGGMNPVPSIVAGTILLLVMTSPSIIQYLRKSERPLAA